MKIKSANLVIAAIGLILSVEALAEDLVLYDIGSQGSYYFYDTESIRRSGDEVTVWVTVDESKNKSVSYRTAKLKWRIDCTEETIGLISYVYYKSNGTLFDSESTKYPSMEPVVPGSTGESLFRKVCLN